MEIVAPREAAKLFAAPQDSLGDLNADVAATLIAATADIALVLDSDGVIRDVAFGSEELAQEGCADWQGQALIEIVTIESRAKVYELLSESATKPHSRWRQVNHPPARGSGPDLPIRYSAVRLGADRIVLIGRDLRAMATVQRRLAEAQQAMEREYERIRGAEMRYRLLFQLASEAVLIIDAANLRVVDANPAAARILARPQKRIVGGSVLESVDAAAGEAIQSMLSAARMTGRIDDAPLVLAGQEKEFLLSASLFRQENSTYFLVRLAGGAGDAVPATQQKSSLLKVVESLPEGFAVTDSDRRILTANPAFLDLAQLATEEQARGELIDRWLGRQGIDANVLIANLQEHGSVRHFATIMRGEYGSTEEVEVAAVSVPGAEQRCFGFAIRSTGWRSRPSASRHELPRSVEQLTELVGRVSLKNLVRETTDMIERLCIEAALELTRDNRASAAEMLGLSRQSLYSKLRRYGLGDLDSDDKSPD
jgi:transcriptional regulator PpsR